MTRSESRDEHRITKPDFDAIMQDGYFRGRIQRAWRVAGPENPTSARPTTGTSSSITMIGAGSCLMVRARRIVIPVRVANQEDLDVGEFETKFSNARPNERNIGFEIAVD